MDLLKDEHSLNGFLHLEWESGKFISESIHLLLFVDLFDDNGVFLFTILDTLIVSHLV